MTHLIVRARARLALLLVFAPLMLVAGSCGADGTLTLSTEAAAEVEAANPQVADSASAEAETAAAPVGSVRAFQATPAFLAHAAQQIGEVDTFRFEYFQESTGGFFDTGGRELPFAVGDVAGDRSRLNMDLGSMLGTMPIPGLSDVDDPSIRVVIDAQTLYMHAPFFAALTNSDSGSPALPGLEWMDTIAAGWGSVDLAELGDVDLLQSFGVGGGGVLDAQAALDMLGSVGDVLDGGEGAVRGVATRVAYASVDIRDLSMATGGLELPPEVDAQPIDLEIHIDAANRVRRVAFTISADDFVSTDGLAGAEVPPQMAGVTLWQQIDFFDFGEPIDVEVPTGATDITAELATLADLGG